jgi:hypothetical protein
MASMALAQSLPRTKLRFGPCAKSAQQHLTRKIFLMQTKGATDEER